MARKIQEIETIVCDVCGEVADGSFSSTTYCNDEVVAEMFCPHDLCITHMGKWRWLCDDQAYERYDGAPSGQKCAEMLQDFIRLMDEEGEG